MKSEKRKAKDVRWFLTFVSLCSLLASPVFSEDTLEQWSKGIEKRDVQQAILTRVFGGDLGPGSEAILNQETGIYTFPKGSSWVRIGQETVYGMLGPKPYLVVTCLFFRKPNQQPVNATSYLFRNTTERPEAISAGYASRERVQAVKLQKLGLTFLVMVDSSEQSGPTQWSAFILSLESSLRPKSVWNSPNSARNFQFGFDDLGGKAERLVLKVTKGQDVQYSAYSWDGERFEIDTFSSESRLKALPDDVWRFGAH